MLLLLLELVVAVTLLLYLLPTLPELPNTPGVYPAGIPKIELAGKAPSPSDIAAETDVGADVTAADDDDDVVVDDDDFLCWLGDGEWWWAVDGTGGPGNRGDDRCL